MITDPLTLSIYREICKCYIEQMKLNISEDPNLIPDLSAEKSIRRLRYLISDDVKAIKLDSFTCSFKDAFDMKLNFDKLVTPKERFYYFNQVPVSLALPVKAKRAYKSRVKPLMPSIPKLSVWKHVLLYLKAA